MVKPREEVVRALNAGRTSIDRKKLVDAFMELAPEKQVYGELFANGKSPSLREFVDSYLQTKSAVVKGDIIEANKAIDRLVESSMHIRAGVGNLGVFNTERTLAEALRQDIEDAKKNSGRRSR